MHSAMMRFTELVQILSASQRQLGEQFAALSAHVGERQGEILSLQAMLRALQLEVAEIPLRRGQDNGPLARFQFFGSHACVGPQYSMDTLVLSAAGQKMKWLDQKRFGKSKERVCLNKSYANQTKNGLLFI